MQLAPNQVLVSWDEERVAILTVQVVRRDWRADAPERRMEELIAETIWATWHLAGLAPAPESPARERRDRDA